MIAIEIINQAYNRQVEARTRWLDANNPDDAPAFAKARKLATACLRLRDYPQLASIAPTTGEFEIDGFKVIRRKVDEVDNIYAMKI